MEELISLIRHPRDYKRADALVTLKAYDDRDVIKVGAQRNHRYTAYAYPTAIESLAA